MRHGGLILTMAVLLVIGGWASLAWAAEEHEQNATVTATIPTIREIITMPTFDTITFTSSDLTTGCVEQAGSVNILMNSNAAWKLEAKVDSTDNFSMQVNYAGNGYTENLDSVSYTAPTGASGSAGFDLGAAIGVKVIGDWTTTPITSQVQTLFVKILSSP